MRVSAKGRRRAWIAGLVAILIAGAWLVWANQSGRREAGRRLAYHRDQYRLNQARCLVGLGAAREAIEGPKRAAAQFREQTEEASLPRIRVDPAPAGGGRSVLEGIAGGGRPVLEGIDEAERRLADATLSASRASYHARMAAFYEDFLGSWGAGLPSIPEELEVDRRMIALQMQRRYRGEMEHGEMLEEVALYNAEPPRRLPGPASGRP